MCRFLRFVIILLISLFLNPVLSETQTSLVPRSSCTLAVTIEGAITAATVDYLKRAEKQALENQCQSLFLRLNTPGGSLQSTRYIVEQMLDSQIPYLCLIAPVGGHAGSAGAIILQACHVNGGLTATNLGAATPILGNGQETPEDLRKKMISDTVSWLEGVTKLRNRNLQFSKEIITEAKSLSIEEAVQIKAMDIVANQEIDFLEQAKGRKVLVKDKQELNVEVGVLRDFEADLRTQVLNFFSDPEFSYLLFMGSLALLYAEITNPGLLVPGVIGSVGLVISLVSFHKLDVEWGGLALLLLGIGLLVAELFITSFGVLGVGGIVSLTLGSLFLFTPEQAGFSLPVGLVLSVVGVIALIFAGLGYLAVKAMRFRGIKTEDAMIGHEGIVLNDQQVQVLGDIWFYSSEDEVKPGEQIVVIERNKLTLRVKKK